MNQQDILRTYIQLSRVDYIHGTQNMGLVIRTDVLHKKFKARKVENEIDTHCEPTTSLQTQPYRIPSIQVEHNPK